MPFGQGVPDEHVTFQHRVAAHRRHETVHARNTRQTRDRLGEVLGLCSAGRQTSQGVEQRCQRLLTRHLNGAELVPTASLEEARVELARRVALAVENYRLFESLRSQIVERHTAA